MKPPVALFKAKSQNLIKAVRCLHKKKNVTKTLKRKIGKSFLKIIFYFLPEFQE